MNLHQMIDRCQRIIIDSMEDASPECTVLFAKDRIDETNLNKVAELAKAVLDAKQADKVETALNFMREALNNICTDYYQWALTTGEMYGRVYDVPKIDTNSLALEGLYKASVRFKPTGSFKSYATAWIRQVIQRHRDQHLVLSLNAPITQGETSTRFDNVTAEDTAWGKSNYFAEEPFKMEELRLKYCKHLSLSEIEGLLADSAIVATAEDVLEDQAVELKERQANYAAKKMKLRQAERIIEKAETKAEGIRLKESVHHIYFQEVITDYIPLIHEDTPTV